MACVKIRENELAQVEKSDFWGELFTGDGSGLKLMDLILTYIDLVGVKSQALAAISKAAQTAAPLCAIPQSLTAATDALRSYVKLGEEQTFDALKKAAYKTLKVSQKVFEAMIGMMKLGVVDAARLVMMKSLKELAAIPSDLQKLASIPSADEKAANETNEVVKALMKRENNCKYMEAVIGLVFHTMKVVSIASSSLVASEIILVLGTLYMGTILAGTYVGAQRQDEENVVAFNQLKSKITVC